MRITLSSISRDYYECRGRERSRSRDPRLDEAKYYDEQRRYKEYVQRERGEEDQHKIGGDREVKHRDCLRARH